MNMSFSSLNTHFFQYDTKTEPRLLRSGSFAGVQTVPLPDGRGSVFEAYFNGKQSGDEYYQQHLSQLQQSAITFDQPINTENTRQHIENTTKESETRDAKTIEPHEIDNQKPGKAQPSIAQTEPVTNHPVDLLAPLLTLIETTLKPIAAAVLPNPIITPITPNKSTLMLQPNPLQAKPAYNPHQLFVQGNQVELTLNTHRLNKQEVTQLKTVIKQWLVQKGYQLNRLIINGVQE